MTKTITIGEKEIKLKASALIPRIYRTHIGRDLMSDMARLQKAYQEIVGMEKDKAFEILDLTTFENVAWAMAYNADNTIPNNPDEWLDSLDGVFSIYTYLPIIMELWIETNKMTSTPKKK